VVNDGICLVLSSCFHYAMLPSSNFGNLSLPQSSLDFKTLVDLTVLTYISGLGTLSFSDCLDITQYSLLLILSPKLSGGVVIQTGCAAWDALDDTRQNPFETAICLPSASDIV
jgi:hypothetical protein